MRDMSPDDMANRVHRIWAAAHTLAAARQIFDVPSTTTEADVKGAYHRMALKLHPDKCASANARDAFIIITTAKDMLIKSISAPHGFRRCGPRKQARGGLATARMRARLARAPRTDRDTRLSPWQRWHRSSLRRMRRSKQRCPRMPRQQKLNRGVGAASARLRREEARPT